MTPTRPVLRYHGGKWKLALWIIAHMPPHISYVEPYGGAASVLLRRPRVPSEVYNDLDGGVVGLFRVLRDPQQAARLIDSLRLTPFARAELDAAYEPTADPVERARRMIVMSFFGHSSKSGMSNARNGFRSKRMGTNSPAVDWSTYPDALWATVERLRGVVIEQREALEVIGIYDGPGSLFYLDPPYTHGSRRDLSQGVYRHEMNDADHEDLSRALYGVKGMVLLSGYRSDLYDSLYSGWTRVERKAYADKASPRVECLWMNPSAAARCPRLGLLAVGE